MLRATAPCHVLASDLPKIPKNGPRIVCFAHFDLEMCFAPQRRAICPRPNFQKMVRGWCVLHILTWKCASRHSGVQLFISHLARAPHPPLLRAYFSTVPTHKSLQKHAKTQCLAPFLTFRAPASFPLSLFYSSLLCFSSLHIVGSLTSKLPFISFIIIIFNHLK